MARHSTDEQRGISSLVAFVILLAGVTLAAMQVERFRAVDDQLARNADFAEDVTGWAVNGPGASLTGGPPRVLVLDAGDASGPTFVGQSIPIDRERYDYLAVTAELRTSALVPGPRAWQRGQLQLASYDDRWQLLRFWPRHVATLEGSNDWRRYEATFPISVHASAVWLRLYVAARSGVMMVRNVRVAGVVERPWFTALKGALALGWLGAWAWAGALHLHRRRCPPLQLGAFALASALILAGIAPQPHFGQTLADLRTTQAGVMASLERWGGSGREDARTAAAKSSSNVDGEAPEARNAAAPSSAAPSRQATSAEQEPPAVDTPAAAPTGKLAGLVRQDWRAHFAAFALLGVATAVAYRKHRTLRYGSVLIGLSASIQLMQSLTATREPDLADMAFDGAGIFTGIALVLLASTAVTHLAPPVRRALDRTMRAL